MKNKLLFTIISMCLFSTQIFATCQANFTWAQTTNNVIAFTDASTGITPASTNFHWDFGDGNYSTFQNPVHTYNVPGTYNVCLTINDSNFIGGCNSIFCDNVTVTGVLICNLTLTLTSTIVSCPTCSDGSATANASNGTAPYTYSWLTIPPPTTSTVSGLPIGTYTCCVTDANGCTACDSITVDTSACQANFTWMQTSNNVIGFTNTSTGTNISTVFYWTFGDGNHSYTQNPAHTYGVPGTYNVCLQISDSNFIGGCTSTFCDSITVTGVNCNNLAVSVTAVNTTCPLCNDGSATATGSGGTPPYSFLWSTGATTQTINNLIAGYYSCCITDAVGCTACAGAVVDSFIVGCSAYFTLTPDILPHTYTAVNLATGTPPLSYTWSWGDATYSYTAFPTHTYAAAGFYLICLSISDAVGCTSMYCDSFYLARMETSNTMVTVHVVSSTTGMPNISLENYLSVFPNPVSDYLVINYSLAASSNIVITLYDILGNSLKSFNEDKPEGKHEVILDMSSMKQGFYMLSFRSNEFVVAKRIAVIK